MYLDPSVLTSTLKLGLSTFRIKVINKQSNFNHLRFAEALSNKRLKLDLYIQKETTMNFSLL